MPNKPTRLYYKSYLAMISNAPGSALFKNFYVMDADGVEFDAMADGDAACAFFVSSVLTIFQKMVGMHGTVVGAVQDMLEHDWLEVSADNLKPGDVIVWEKQQSATGVVNEHIGFYITDNTAVSTSSSQKIVVQHDLQFSDDKPRAITNVYRAHWPNSRSI